MNMGSWVLISAMNKDFRPFYTTYHTLGHTPRLVGYWDDAESSGGA